MRIQQNNLPSTPRQLPARKEDAPAGEPKDTVTFNKENNSYEYHSAYGTRSVKNESILGSALGGAALVGLPAALGAVEGGALGKAWGSLTIPMNIGLGGLVGMGVGARKGYKEATEGLAPPPEGGMNVAGLPRAGLYGFFGGLGGLIGGAVLPLAGLYGGPTGAIVATAVGAALGAVNAVQENRNHLRDAIQKGYDPNSSV